MKLFIYVVDYALTFESFFALALGSLWNFLEWKLPSPLTRIIIIITIVVVKRIIINDWQVKKKSKFKTNFLLKSSSNICDVRSSSSEEILLFLENPHLTLFLSKWFNTFLAFLSLLVGRLAHLIYNFSHLKSNFFFHYPWRL